VSVDAGRSWSGPLGHGVAVAATVMVALAARTVMMRRCLILSSKAMAGSVRIGGVMACSELAVGLDAGDRGTVEVGQARRSGGRGGWCSGGAGREPEEVASAADVAAGGGGFGVDAVAAQIGNAAGEVEGEPDPEVAGRLVSAGGAVGDEQVGAGGVGPAGVAVLEPRGEAVNDRGSEPDRAVVEVQA
jgi:hypothetical protein